jgi:hypothetical protein
MLWHPNLEIGQSAHRSGAVPRGVNQKAKPRGRESKGLSPFGDRFRAKRSPRDPNRAIRKSKGQFAVGLRSSAAGRFSTFRTRIVDRRLRARNDAGQIGIFAVLRNGALLAQILAHLSLFGFLRFTGGALLLA